VLMVYIILRVDGLLQRCEYGD